MINRKRQGYIVIYEVTSYDPELIPTYLKMVKEDYGRFGPAMSAIIDVRVVSEYGLPPILMKELRQAMPELMKMDIRPVGLVGANIKTPVGRMATALEYVEDDGRYRFFADIETAVVWINQWYEDNNIDRDALFKDQQSKKPELLNINPTDADILNNMFADIISTDKYLSSKITQIEKDNDNLNGLERCTGSLKLEGSILRVQHSRAKDAPECPMHGRSRPVIRGEEVSLVKQAQARHARIATNKDMMAIYATERRRLRDMIIDLWASSWEIRGLPNSREQH